MWQESLYPRESLPAWGLSNGSVKALTTPAEQALTVRPIGHDAQVPENLTVEELRESLERFVRYRAQYLRGDEKGEAAIFLENLFRALGHEGVRQAGATLEQRIQRRDNGGTAYADLEWKPRVLIEMKKAGRDLTRDYRQAFEYWIDMVPDRPAFVILCNFDEFWVYDFNRQLDEPVDRLALADLPRRWDTLAFLLPREQEPVFGNDQVAVTRNTAAMVSRVFNRLIERGIERDPAQRFILQAVMAMFSEDIGLLPRHDFTRAVEDSIEGRGSAYDLIFGLFREMNTPGEHADRPLRGHAVLQRRPLPRHHAVRAHRGRGHRPRPGLSGGLGAGPPGHLRHAVRAVAGSA